MYQLRAPAPALRPFIEHYWFVDAEDGPVDIRVDVFVDARADLVFNAGAPYLREVIGGARTEHRRANLDAQRLVPIRIVQRGDVRIAGVRFHLGGLGPFCRGALRPWTGKTPDPIEVFGDDALVLERDLAQRSTIDAHAQRLDAFFLQRLVLDEPHARFRRALAHLSAADGNAGQVTQIIRGLFGPSYVNNAAFVGIGLMSDGDHRHLELVVDLHNAVFIVGHIARRAPRGGRARLRPRQSAPDL